MGNAKCLQTPVDKQLHFGVSYMRHFDRQLSLVKISYRHTKQRLFWSLTDDTLNDDPLRSFWSLIDDTLR